MSIKPNVFDLALEWCVLWGWGYIGLLFSMAHYITSTWPISCSSAFWAIWPRPQFTNHPSVYLPSCQLLLLYSIRQIKTALCEDKNDLESWEVTSNLLLHCLQKVCTIFIECITMVDYLSFRIYLFSQEQLQRGTIFIFKQTMVG